MSGGNRVSEMYLGLTGSRDSQVHERERVHWVCSQVAGVRVLEVGASQGIVSILLAREGFSVVGTEVEKASFEYAVAARAQEPDSVRDRLEFRLTDGSLDDFEDGSFDTVILGEVVEHLVQPLRLLDEVDRVLAPGGRLVVTTTIGLYEDLDHKESLFPSDLITWFGDRYVYVDSTFITFPLGRFNNIGLTMVKPDSGTEVSRGKYVDPLLLITERALWEVQQGAETLRLETVSLRDAVRDTREERDTVRRELVEARNGRDQTREEIEMLRRQLQDQFATLAAAYGAMDRWFHTLTDDTASAQAQQLAVELADTRNQLGVLERQLGELATWKGVRVGIAMAQSGSPSQMLRFPGRLRKALQPLDPPPIRPVTSPTEVLAEAGINPQLLRHRSTPVYPHLRIIHHGESATYSALIPHLPLDMGRIEEHLERGADLVLIEPSPTTPPVDPAIVERFTSEGIPVVVYARNITDLETHISPSTTLLITDNPDIAQTATTRTATPVLALDPSIDPAIYNPIGFQRHPDNGPVIILTDPPKQPRTKTDNHLLTHPGTDLYLTPTTTANPTRISTTGTLTTPTDIATTLKHHTAVIDTPTLHHTETSYLTQILRYAATGTPIITTTSPNLTRLIPPDLIHQPATEHDTAAIIDHLTTNPFERERHSVKLRRHVLTHHTHKHRIDTLLTHLDIPLPKPDTISILFVTNRPDFLTHAYTQITNQTYPHKELITVLHGDHFDTDHVTTLTQTLTIPHTLINAPNHWTLGDCLNAAIDASTGTLITKMDDDDYYGPNHLTDLTTARTYTNADIIGKRMNFVVLEQLNILTEWGSGLQEQQTPHLPGATMLMSSDLAMAYRYPRLSSGEDSDLLKRVRDDGGILYSTHGFDFVRRRHGVHSFTRSDAFFLNDGEYRWKPADLSKAMT
jgi:SAM-dependent methyltransferase